MGHLAISSTVVAHAEGGGFHLDGVEVLIAAAVIAAAVLGPLVGYAVARRQNRYWRTAGFRHLILLSQLYGHFNIGDVTIAFDPTCASERRRLTELWRRSKDDPEVAAAMQPHDQPDVTVG